MWQGLKPSLFRRRFAARLNSLRKKAPMRDFVIVVAWQGLKPDPCFQAFAARLKPCPCYKASISYSQTEFFRKLLSRAEKLRNEWGFGP